MIDPETPALPAPEAPAKKPRKPRATTKAAPKKKPAAAKAKAPSQPEASPELALETAPIATPESAAAPAKPKPVRRKKQIAVEETPPAEQPEPPSTEEVAPAPPDPAPRVEPPAPEALPETKSIPEARESKPHGRQELPPASEQLAEWRPQRREPRPEPAPDIQTAEDESVLPDEPYEQTEQQERPAPQGPHIQASRQETVVGEGLLEVSGKGFGFLRDPSRNFQQSPQDIFVTPELVRRFGLRDGLWLSGEVRRGQRGPQLLRLQAINEDDPEKHRFLPVFEELTSLNPMEWIKLETTPDRFTTRVMDLITPIGKGQRGLIVAPPRTGKTTLLQHIGDAVLKNHPDIKLIILLVDERPEEVTEIRRSVPQAEIMASSNDSDLKSHTRIAQLAIERAKRLVESGRDVFMLLDSMTRVGRAFNNAMAVSGRTLSGGMDARAMEIPRRLFAAARNTDEAGSLTIIATALIQTGSRMDELIFQEFKGTGNMELVLDRNISDQRVYPAVDIFLSGTRREELILPAHWLDKINIIRRGLAGHRPIEAIDRLLSFLKKFPQNEQMLMSIPSA